VETYRDAVPRIMVKPKKINDPDENGANHSHLVNRT
jgi:hypothetical protein